jgi:hypothetical protein
MSNFLELAIQGRRLAASKGLRPMAFCDVMEAGDLPIPSPRRRRHREVANSTGAAPNKSMPSRTSGRMGIFRTHAPDGL